MKIRVIDVICIALLGALLIPGGLWYCLGALCAFCAFVVTADGLRTQATATMTTKER